MYFGLECSKFMIFTWTLCDCASQKTKMTPFIEILEARHGGSHLVFVVEAPTPIKKRDAMK